LMENHTKESNFHNLYAMR